MEVQIDLKLYAVQSKDGKWLRAKGYSGSGNSWVENIEDAKIYPKLGNARRQVTWWSNHFPDFGIPLIIEFQITKGIIIDETERVKKSMEKKKTKEERMEVNQRKWELREAERKFKEAQDRLPLLKQVKCSPDLV